MKKKLLTLMTLLLCVCSGAWADTEINFSGTVNSATNNTSTGLAVTGGTMYWSGLQGGDNSVTIDGVTYYKMGGDAAYVQLKLTDGSFKSGDVLKVTAAAKSEKTVTLSLKSNSGTKFTSTNKASSTATASFTYTLTAADIESDGSIKIFRGGDTNIRVATFAITGTRSDAALADANLALTSASSVKLAIGSTSNITYTTDSDADVEFTSSNPSVATVSDAGVITAKSSGIAAITVAQAANATYDEAATSVEVIVPYTATSADEYTIGSDTYKFSDSSNNYYFDNGFEMSNNGNKGYGAGGLTGTMKYSAGTVYTITIPEGITLTGATVTARSNYSSKDPTANWGTIFGEDYSSVNLPNSDDEVEEGVNPAVKTFTFDGGATGTLTVKFGGNQVLAKIVFTTKTGTPTTEVGGTAVFDFSSKKSWSSKTQTVSGITATVAQDPQNGYVSFKKNDSWTIAAENGKLIKKIAITYVSDKVATENTVTAAPEGINAAGTQWEGLAQSITITNPNTSSANNNAQISGLTVTYVEAEAVSTLTNRNYGTCVTSSALDFTDVTAARAYVATDLEGSSVNITRVYKVPANTPIIVYTDNKDDATTVYIPKTTDDADAAVADNALIAGDGSTAWNGTSGYTYYYLASDKFHKATSGTLVSGKAYLKVEGDPTASQLTIDFNDGNTTGIKGVSNAPMTTDNAVYNLAGQRVAQPTKGLYIVNGKKVVIK